MVDYTEDFNVFWSKYRSPKNSSKTDAFKAWNQKVKSRPALEKHLATIEAYDKWLEEQHKSNKNDFPAKKHAATWIRKECWDTFMDDAERIIVSGKAVQAHSQADRIASTKTWEGAPMASLMAKLGGSDGDTPRESIFEAWIAPTVMIRSMPIEIRCPSKFHRDYLESKFGKVIRSALGPDTIITVAMDEKKAPAEG